MVLQLDDVFLPATLSAPPMTDEEFAAFCAEHPDLFFEMTAQGELLVMPPAETLTGIRNSELDTQLRVWARQDGRGVAADSSTGFLLPNGARRSPDAAWISKARIQSVLGPRTLGGYWPLAPDFVIELKSRTDRLSVLRAKMREWIANGAELGWMLIPESRTVEIYRPGQASPEILTEAASVAGEGPIEGFELDLTLVWDPLA